jgi:hypothetical protein
MWDDHEWRVSKDLGGVIMPKFKVLSGCLPVGTDKTHKSPQSG